MKAMAVTGFVPNAFEAKHFSPGQAEQLGDRLKTVLAGRICSFDPWRLQDCWAHDLLDKYPDIQPSCAHPPADRFHNPKDMVLSNIVLLQRYEWMQLAAQAYPDVDVFAWIEYTVLKQRGMNGSIVSRFMDDLEAHYYDAISLPGCWPKGTIDDRDAHWRFCGSCWVCPKKYVSRVCQAIQTVVGLRTDFTHKLSWDMNSMAYVELLDILPIRWYQANHDETQFTHFSGGL